MKLEKPDRKWFEGVLVGLVVLVAMLLTSSNTYYQQKVGKEKALFYQLQSLRGAVILYRAINNRNPDSLMNMANETYKLPRSNVVKSYIEEVSLNSDGQIIDPFGNPYYYDGQAGWVRSTTSDHESW